MRRDILLLQGPIGPFFSHLATELTDRGFRVHKVNLNGGDKLFYKHDGAIDYAGELQHWDAFLERLIINKKIGRIYLYGDCRVYHRIAREVAKRLDVRVFVFEEGYIRPNFITLEENGVNGHSAMVNKGFNLPRVTDTPPPESEFTSNTFFRIACYSMMYYMSSFHGRSLFPGYQHHRDFRCISEGLRWINSGIRKLRFKRKEKHILSNLFFIGEVMTSFAEHAPKNKAIVFKHHPLDRGYTDYTNLFANFVSELGLQGRVFYVHDVCLPTLLQHAQGTVVINSTVGMSSLLYGTPVKTLGKAIYNLPGITSKLSLNAFWRKPGKVDEPAFAHLRNYLVTQNQLNGNLYKSMIKGSVSGLLWPEKLIAEHTYVEDALDVPTATPNLRIVAGLDVKTGTESDRSDDSKAA